MPVINVLALSSKSTLHCLLCDNRLEPHKYFFCQLVWCCAPWRGDTSRTLEEKWTSLPRGCSCHHTHAGHFLQHWTPIVPYSTPQHQAPQWFFQLQTPMMQAWLLQSPEPGAFLVTWEKCHSSSDTQWIAFHNTPRGEQRSTTVTPLCEQTPLHSFGALQMSSEMQHLHMDGFPEPPWEIFATSTCSSSATLPYSDMISLLEKGLGISPSLDGHFTWSISGLRVEWLFLKSAIPEFFQVLFTSY